QTQTVQARASQGADRNLFGR
ncbi:DUF680 domain-containing protein, partial [Mesorhizobium sp. M7A.F.Ca.CA.001.07.2.1]